MLLPLVQAATEEREFTNPLGSTGGTIQGLLYEIVNVLLVFAIPVIVFFIIYAGFNYVTAQGNPEKIKTATRSLLYALIGAVIVLGAFAVSSIVKSVVCEFSSTPDICRSA